MTKSELIQVIAEKNPSLHVSDIEHLVSAIFEKITEALAGGDRVEIRGFGAFSVREREARVGRNPKTGEAVEVPAKKTPFFKVGKELKEKVNN